MIELGVFEWAGETDLEPEGAVDFFFEQSFFVEGCAGEASFAFCQAEVFERGLPRDSVAREDELDQGKGVTCLVEGGVELNFV